MKKNSINNPMAPLWIKYPHITQWSIGWRMGYGESYLMDFNNWYQKLPEKDRLKYQEMFPSPKTWIGYYTDYFEDDVLDDNACLDDDVCLDDNACLDDDVCLDAGDAGLDEDDSYLSNNGYLEKIEEHFYKDVLFWRKNGIAKYSKDKLIAISDEHTEFIFFWNPGNTPQSCLSHWTKSDFEVDIDKYNCMEQYMMAEKARFFDDLENREKIMELNDPYEMKKLGRKIRNFNSKEWNKVKYSIVLNGNYYKFSQNKEMRDFLLATGNKVLVEASPKDKIWGVGLDESNDDIYDLNKWEGENLVGFALMELRDELKKVYKKYDK